MKLLDACCSPLISAQVGEWLKPADCKSAPPWRYEGSNPSLCTIIMTVRLTAKSCDKKIVIGAVGLCRGCGVGDQDVGRSTSARSDAGGACNVRGEDLGAKERCDASGWQRWE